jgi:long-chain acyl-CoA synthetase
VEVILFTHPKVALAAVVGVSDSKNGEAIKAFIQLKLGETSTEEEIRHFCKANMAGFRLPNELAHFSVSAMHCLICWIHTYIIQ